MAKEVLHLLATRIAALTNPQCHFDLAFEDTSQELKDVIAEFALLQRSGADE